ncbi:MAG TPA: hypothetical protein VNA17_09175 [Pyrinomonadaceae bacterium]|nr:hypothetical protein [Pyrinomonadaceae bacterium]
MFLKSAANFGIGFAIIIAAFSTVVAQAHDDLDIAALLIEVKQKSDANWRKVIAEHQNYTYKWRKIWRKTDKRGRVEEESEVNELFYPTRCAPKKCRRVEFLLEKNGKLLPPEKIEKQRARAARKLEQIESDPKAAALPLDPNVPLHWMNFGYWVRKPFSSTPELIVAVDGQEILEKSEFFAPSREQINGREAIVLSFRPRTGAVFSEKTKYMAGTEGKLWIGAADRVLIRLAIWPIGTQFAENTSDYLLSHAAGARSMLRTSEGLWFPSLGRVNGLDHPKLFMEVKGDFSIDSFDYHYFKTEVRNVEVNDPAKKD